MNSGEILLKKAETLIKIKNIYNSLTSLNLNWDEYPWELEGSESLRAYYELVAKYKNLMYKFYVLAAQDWNEINEIYKKYCLMDGAEVVSDLAHMATALQSTIEES